MERASRIFYNYTQQYSPELLSKQYEQFDKAAREVSGKKSADKISFSNEQMSLESLSKALIGLSDQSMSYRREAHDQDYL